MLPHLYFELACINRLKCARKAETHDSLLPRHKEAAQNKIFWRDSKRELSRAVKKFNCSGLKSDSFSSFSLPVPRIHGALPRLQSTLQILLPWIHGKYPYTPNLLFVDITLDWDDFLDLFLFFSIAFFSWWKRKGKSHKNPRSLACFLLSGCSKILWLKYYLVMEFPHFLFLNIFTFLKIANL